VLFRRQAKRPRFRRERRAGLELLRPDSDTRGRGVLNLGRCLSGGVRLTLLQLLRKPAFQAAKGGANEVFFSARRSFAWLP